jgi:hypothetical protein
MLEAVKFLEEFRPGGPWQLHAITPNVPGVKTTWCTTPEAAGAWVEEHSGRDNCYFTVNSLAKPLDKKPQKADISTVDYLHVDIDARKDQPIAEELRRIEAVLTESCPVPVPTFISFSGGGYQCLWKLRTPIRIDGDLARAEDAELYNKQLANLLGGDSCHNVDRMMRLPGTFNIPDARKAARGRIPAEAHLCRHDEGRVYELAAFQQAAEKRRRDDAPLAIPPSVEHIDLEKLHLNARLKRIALEGRIAEEPKDGDDSRSAWVFDFLCNGMRQGVDDAVLYGIIMDSRFAISASVLEKPRPHDYALRQLAEARKALAEDPTPMDPVAWVNARYFAAQEGGKVAFYREANLEAMQSSAFDFELLPMKHQDAKGTPIPYSAIWRQSDKRRYYPRGLILDPKAPASSEHYNLWRGFAVDPQPGAWDWIRIHVEEVLANDDARHADYILKWVAWTLQNPHRPARVALVFQSDQEGVGKGAFCNALVKLFGPHGLRIQDMMQLCGRFNAHLRNCCLLFADEAVSPGSEGESSLKGYITEPTIPIERKGVDVVQAENHLHIVMSSNNRAIVPAGLSARRFAVFHAGDQHAGDHGYFDRLFREINGRGLSAMLYDLLQMDLEGWHPESARPDTDALSRQKVESLGPVEATWFDVLLEGEGPCDRNDLPVFTEPLGDGWKVLTEKMRDYVRESKRRPDISSNKIADLFKRLGYRKSTVPRPNGYEAPSIEQARRDWDEHFFPWDWEGEGVVDGVPF